MRGEIPRRSYSAATIVDDTGTPKYHILPSKIITIGVLSMGLLVIIAIILGFLILQNKSEIEILRDKIKVEDKK